MAQTIEGTADQKNHVLKETMLKVTETPFVPLFLFPFPPSLNLFLGIWGIPHQRVCRGRWRSIRAHKWYFFLIKRVEVHTEGTFVTFGVDMVVVSLGLRDTTIGVVLRFLFYPDTSLLAARVRIGITRTTKNYYKGQKPARNRSKNRNFKSRGSLEKNEMRCFFFFFIIFCTSMVRRSFDCTPEVINFNFIRIIPEIGNRKSEIRNPEIGNRKWLNMHLLVSIFNMVSCIHLLIFVIFIHLLHIFLPLLIHFSHPV